MVHESFTGYLYGLADLYMCTMIIILLNTTDRRGMVVMCVSRKTRLKIQHIITNMSIGQPALV